jgi:hypothetical protein
MPTQPIKLSRRRKEVMKHSSAVQITNSITLLQRRAWNILLAKAYDDLDNADRHQIRVRELVEMLDYKSNDDSHLKDALEKLTTTAVKWNILSKDKSLEWGVFPLLSGAVIRQGVLTYAFSPLLKERLYNPRMYARISLSLQNRFQSKHALALYELCVDYFDLSRNYGETPFIPISEFRELMGVGDEEYPSFARLNDKVIKRAVQEINELSDLMVDVRMQRTNRKIDELKFCIFRKTELALPFSPTEAATPPPAGEEHIVPDAMAVVAEVHAPTQTSAQKTVLQTPRFAVSATSSEYDLLFDKLPVQQQQRILQEAFSMLPDLVKEYEYSDPAVAEKVVKPLMLQKRDEILQKIMQQAG